MQKPQLLETQPASYETRLGQLGFIVEVPADDKGRRLMRRRKQKFLTTLDEVQLIELLASIELDVVNARFTERSLQDDFNMIQNLVLAKTVAMKRKRLGDLIARMATLQELGMDSGRLRHLLQQLRVELTHKISRMSQRISKIVSGGGAGNGTGRSNR